MGQRTISAVSKTYGDANDLGERPITARCASLWPPGIIVNGSTAQEDSRRKHSGEGR